MREVAVVIPNYNGIQFLEPCLEALRAQTFREFQTILVDNGSSDGSLALVRERYRKWKLRRCRRTSDSAGLSMKGSGGRSEVCDPFKQ